MTTECVESGSSFPFYFVIDEYPPINDIQIVITPHKDNLKIFVDKQVKTFTKERME